jgi:hypothetical protein
MISRSIFLQRDENDVPNPCPPESVVLVVVVVSHPIKDVVAVNNLDS